MRASTGRQAFVRAGLAAVALTVAPAAQAQPEMMSDRTLARFVHSGEEDRIGFFWGLNEDCSVQRGFNVSVVGLPRHGEARLEKTLQVLGRRLAARQWGSGPQVERLRRCVGVEVPVISLFYRAKPGFVGFDEVVVLRTNPTGQRQMRRDFRIAVKP